MPESLPYKDLMAVTVALVSAVIALVSLHRTGRLHRQQMRLQGMQLDLVRRQLALVRKQEWLERGVGSIGPSTAQAEDKADVRVEIIRPDRDYHLMIVNRGLAAARDVRVELTPWEGCTSPLLESEYREKVPVAELVAGGQCALHADVTFDTGIAWDASWSWMDPDGSRQERKAQLVAPLGRK
jgi:hypothetical protein